MSGDSGSSTLGYGRDGGRPLEEGEGEWEGEGEGEGEGSVTSPRLGQRHRNCSVDSTGFAWARDEAREEGRLGALIWNASLQGPLRLYGLP